MHKFLVAYRFYLVPILAILAFIVAMRKLLISGLGVWTLTGIIGWALLSLANGREISIMFYSLGYASLTVLLFSLAVKFVRMIRSRPVRTLQPAN